MSSCQVATALVREAVASARSQPLHSVIALLTVAAVCAVTLLTAGQGAAAEAAALAKIDAVGTRTIAIRVPPEAGLEAAVVERVRAFDEVASVTAFSAARDLRNGAFASGPPVAARTVVGDLAESLGGRPSATTRAAQVLGLVDGNGWVQSADGMQLAVAGVVELPSELEALDPVLLVPSDESDLDRMTLVVVVARSPEDVGALGPALVDVLGVDDPGTVTIDTPAALVELRTAIGGELSRQGATTILLVMATGAGLLALNMLMLVRGRRKDFGRRRALGASREFIVGLLLVQVLVVAASGVVVGMAIGWVVIRTRGMLMPDAQFCVALCLATVGVAVCAAVLPALFACLRAPLHELRIP